MKFLRMGCPPRTLVFWAIGLLASPAVAEDRRPVITDHPPLLGTRHELQALARQRPAEYQRVVAVARQSGADAHAAIISQSLVAAIEGDAELAGRAKQRVLKYVDGPIREGHVTFGHDLALSALAYDLCFEYEMHACADYFPNVADKLGENLGVDKARRFSGLSGYQKLIESGVEAVTVLDVPYFYPEQAKAAVETGCHVYMAKPVAVDVPGTFLIGELGKQASRKNRSFLVDYQLLLDPANHEVITRVRDGALEGLAHIVSFGKTNAWADPQKGPTMESRLQNVIWLSDIALSGDTIVSYDIHLIDGLMALLGKPAVSATGASRICRKESHGDRVDACGVVFELDDGTRWTHVTQSLKNDADFTDLSASVYGLVATAHLAYRGKVFVRGGTKHYVGEISKEIYNDGATRNVADFYRNITEGHFENATVKRAVDGHLTAIMGLEAAARHVKLTLAELIMENKKLAVDLTGLKA